MTDKTTKGEPTEQKPPLFLIKGDASPEEVAALTVVLQTLAVAGAAPAKPAPRSQWAHPARSMRGPVSHGQGGWRAGALPR